MLRYAVGPALARPQPRWEMRAHARAATDFVIIGDRIASIGGRGDDELVLAAAGDGALLERRLLDWAPRKIAVAPAGSWIAIGAEQDDDLRAWQLGATMAPLAIEGRRSTDALHWFDDRSLVVVDGALALWELATAPRLRWRHGDPGDASADALRHLVVIDAGTLGVLRVDGSGSGRIEQYRAADGAPARTIPLEPTFPRADLDGALVVAPDRRRLAWAHAYGRGDIDIVETANGRSVARVAAAGAVTAMVWLDDRRIAAGSADGRLRLLDADTGNELGTIQAHAHAIAALAVLGDDLLVAVGDGTLARWPIAAFSPAPRAEPSPIRAITATSPGLLAAGDTEIVRIEPDGAWRWTQPRPAGDVSALALAPDRNIAAVATSWRPANASTDERSSCTIVEWDDGTMRAVVEIEGRTRAIAIEPGGDVMIALAPNQGPAEELRPLGCLHAGGGSVTHHRGWGSGLVHAMIAGLAPARLYAALNDGRIVVLAGDLDVPSRAWKAHAAPAVALYLHGEALVSLGLDARAVVSDPGSGAVLREVAFTRHPKRREGPLQHAAIDGGRALALSFRLPHVEVVELGDARLRGTVELPAAALAIAATGDGSVFAVACEGGAVRVFDAVTLAPLGAWDAGGTLRQLAWADARTLFARNAAGQLHGLVLER